MNKVRRPLKVVITTGDSDGIGAEVSAKALAKIKPRPGVQFYIWRSPKCSKSHLNTIDSCFNRITVNTWPEALNLHQFNPKNIIDIKSSLSPAHWVETSAKAANYGHIDAITTAPLSKTTISRAGLKDIGHTDILKRVSKTKELYMTFVGSQFSVVLSTGHIPLADVSSSLNNRNLFGSCLAANKVREFLPKNISKKPIAVLGLNPHAGEGGLIGKEEIKYKLLFEKLKEKKISFCGPLVPDAAFFPEQQKKVSVYVCPYHDQALIPFKLVHGQEEGVQITMGLPFIRTSVDHGTAKNIFGKNKAKPNSMIEAISWAIKLSKKNLDTKFK